MAKEANIALSGGFDPLHIGHIRMIKDAMRLGRVVIIMNTDEWLMKKKNFVFMPFDERKEVMKNIHGVVRVIKADDEDGSVCETLYSNKDMFDYFGNGGDRTAENTPELEVCEELGITPIFNLGGEKIQSSSELVSNASRK